MVLKKYTIGFVFGILITALLSLIIIVGVSSSPISDARDKYGSIKLAILPPESNVIVDAVYSTADITTIDKIEKVESVLSTPEIPTHKTTMENLEIDFTTEVVGTVDLGGVPALAVGTGFGGGAYTLGDVDDLPYPIYAPTPIYPSAMRRVGRELKVVVRILLDANGNVTAVEPINKNAETALFHQSAATTIKKWRFYPCQKGGKAVSCVADQPITFTLNN